MINILENDESVDSVCACQENRHENAFLNFAKKAFTNLQINIPIHILLTGQAISELFAKV